MYLYVQLVLHFELRSDVMVSS